MAKRAHLTFTGDVDGTGYRFFLQQKAQELGLKGFIEKKENGIYVVIEGKTNAVDEYIIFIQKGASPQAVTNEFSLEIFDTLIGYTTLQSDIA